MQITITILLVVTIILFSMVLHEVMHGLVAYFLGDDTAKMSGRLSLNPLKHIDPFMTIILPVLLLLSGMPVFGGAKPVPFNALRVRHDEWGVATVAIAGPLTNLFIAFIAFGISVIIGGSSVAVSSVLGYIVNVNLGFFAFNILPIPPLDGSRVFYAIAPDFVRRGLDAVESMGVIVIFAIVLLASGFIGSFMSYIINAIIALFSAIFGIG